MATSGAAIRVLGDRNLDYVTHRELDAALALLPPGCEARWIASDDPRAPLLDGADGVWVAPGSPYRNDEAVLAALKAAREGGVPLLATCGGFQYAALELARNAATIPGAQHAEVAPEAGELVIAPLACSLVQKTTVVRTVAGTRLAAIAGTQPFDGFHWCGYSIAPRYLPRLRAAGLVESAHSDEAGLEGFELKGHPFYLATLFQPQVGTSQSRTLHPLIRAFAEAALSHRERRGAR
jgi:CTP synthase (UTP-ammonia lyase)